MCGQETASLTPIETEGTELNVCSDCEEFGTVLHDEASQSSGGESSAGGGPSRSSSGGRSSSSSSGTSSGGGGGGSRSDPMEDIETLAADYDARVREAREAAGMTQEDVADELNEKASLIRKIEGGDMRPSEEVRDELERFLDVSLTEEVGDADWDGGDTGDGYTLGDIIERKE